MNKKRKKLTRTVILISLSVIWVLFILWNASRTGDESRVLSDAITNTIKDSIEAENNAPSVFDGTDAIYSAEPDEDGSGQVLVNAYRLRIFIRKSGHLLEYSLLAFLVSLTLISMGKKKDVSFLATLWFGGLIAFSDELIQSHTDGRSGKFTDVLIDLCGCIMGAFIAISVLLLLYYLIQRRKNNKKSEKCKKISEND